MAPCNARNGKLVTARRYNAVPDLGTVEVAEEYRYDGLGGRPTKRTTTVTGTASFSGAQFETSQGWDELGNLVSITYPSTGAVAPARTVNYAYKHGFLTEVVGYGTIAYHPTATVAKVTHSNTVSETTDLHTGMTRPLRIKATSAGGATLWQTGDYEYDGAGNITEVGDTAYDYDAMNRLTAWTVSSPGWAYKTVRTLDAFGNATRTTSLGCPEPASGLQDCFETSFGRSVDAATNHYDFQTYDDAGSVIADGVHSFTYDGAAMPVSVSSDLRNDRFLYTADDERLAIVSRVPSSGGTRNRTTWTVRGTSNQLLRTFTDDATSGTRIWSWTEDEIWRGGQILASESPGSTKHYYLDHLGSPRFIADAAGNRLGEQNYGPFGGGGTSDGGRIQFTGHEVDSDRLTYMHARYYDGGVGRFLSVDPGRDWDLHQPQSWNMYSYVRNNPVLNTDPDGRACWPCIGGLVGGAIGTIAGGAYETYAVIKEGRPVNNKNIAKAAAVGAVIGVAAGFIFAPDAGGPDLADRTTTPAPEPSSPPDGDTTPRVQKMSPEPKAMGPHTTFKRSATTDRVSGYETYDPNGNPTKRFRGEGIPHGGQEPPVVLEPKRGKGPGAKPKVPRKPTDDELPNGYQNNKE